MKKIQITLFLNLLVFCGLAQKFKPMEHVTKSTSRITSSMIVDLDGDSLKDILISSAINKIAWYKNLGSGIFGTQTQINSNQRGVLEVFAEDMDGDGDNDILSVSESDNKIVFIENLGSGNFSSSNLILDSNWHPNSIYAAYINGDTLMDIVVTYSGSYKGRVVWFENLGGLSFSRQNVIVSSNSNSPHQSLKIIDIDNDGDQDIFSAKEDNWMYWFENMGSGTFTSHFVISTLGETSEVDIKDIDGDGDLDFFYAHYDYGAIYMLRNDTGVFSAPILLKNGITKASSIKVEDIDNDGNLDLLTSSETLDKVIWYKNLGGLTFGLENIISSISEDVSGLAIGDYNNDGKTDVVSYSNLDGWVARHENLGSGLFANEIRFDKGLFRASSIHTNDMDNDGDLDLMSTSYGDSLFIFYENIGNGEYGPGKILASQRDYPASISSGLIDSDTLPDIMLAIRGENRLIWFKNMGSNVFVIQDTISSGISSPNIIKMADLDNDGDDDVVVASEWTNSLRTYHNNGSGVFTLTSSHSGGVCYRILALDINDVDNDGNLDIGVSNYSLEVGIFINNGTGAYTSYTYPYSGAGVNSFQNLKLKDINKDNKPDIIVTESGLSSDFVRVALNMGSNIFSSYNTLFFNSGGSASIIWALEVEDFDMDGDNDILFSLSDSWDKKLKYIENKDSMVFIRSNIFDYNMKVGNILTEAGDFDNDGKIDIIAASRSYEDDIVIYKNCIDKVIKYDTICQGDRVLFNGNYYSLSGEYEDSTQNILGCDSINVLRLLVQKPSKSNLSGILCGANFTLPSGRVVFTSGVFQDTINSFVGCDSVITFSLTLKYLDTSIQLIYPFLKSNDSLSKYQWIDCNNGFLPLSGDTNRWFTITTSGSYAVVVTNGVCSDTSSCLTINNVGLNEENLLNEVSIFPNPTNGSFTLSLKVQTELNRIFITDINGRLIKEITPQNVSQYEISFEGASGVYLLNITSENNLKTIKIIKE